MRGEDGGDAVREGVVLGAGVGSGPQRAMVKTKNVERNLYGRNETQQFTYPL